MGTVLTALDPVALDPVVQCFQVIFSYQIKGFSKMNFYESGFRARYRIGPSAPLPPPVVRNQLDYLVQLHPIAEWFK